MQASIVQPTPYCKKHRTQPVISKMLEDEFNKGIILSKFVYKHKRHALFHTMLSWELD